MMTSMATKLKKLFVDEVSGVDAPANQIPGWAMQKAFETAVTTSAAELEAEADAFPEVTPAERGFLRRALDAVRKSTTQETDMTREELIEILDERDAAKTELAKSAEESEAQRQAEITAEAERIVAERDAEAAAEAERLAAEAETTEPVVEAETETETETPAEPVAEVESGPSAEDFNTLSERVETLATVMEKQLEVTSALLKRSGARQSLPEPPAAEVEELAKASAPAAPAGIQSTITDLIAAAHTGRNGVARLGAVAE